MIVRTTGDPANLATSGVFCDPGGQATWGMHCEVDRPKPAGRPRRRYFADDIDLEQMRIRARVLRDQRDTQDMLEMVRLLNEVN